MQNPKGPRMAKVVETKDGIYINGHFVPYILCNSDNSSTTKVKPEGNYVEVTISFLARSYSFKNKQKRKYGYRFYKLSRIKQFLLRIINR